MIKASIMKFVLYSKGFHMPNTVEAVCEASCKPQDQITIGIINEVYAVEEDILKFLEQK